MNEELLKIIRNLNKFDESFADLFKRLKATHNIKLLKQYEQYSDLWNSLISLNNNITDLLNDKPVESSFQKFLLENYKNKDLSKITNLYCSGYELTDLDGIDKFVNLKILDCSNNKLVYLENFENSNIEEIYCSNNKIKSLYGLQKSKLKYLHCNNNQLESLEFINSDIQHIFCENNQINNLDVVNELTSLKTLFCKNNLVDADDIKITISNFNI